MNIRRSFSIPTLPIWLSLALLLGVTTGRSQWTTQVQQLNGGWNGVYLHVDASHDTLDTLVGADPSNPIEEIWLWQRARTGEQFVESPQVPSSGASWATWTRVPGPIPTTLTRLVKNAAYLVKVRSNVVSYAWSVRGRPVAPSYDWTSAGLNFVGFPTFASNPVNFDAFLKPAPELQSSEIYYYRGGELSSTNPAFLSPLPAQRVREPVRRDRAYWIRAGDLFNRYFGPFELTLPGGGEINFGETGGEVTMRWRNLTSSNLTVTVALVASESPVPNGQPNIVGVPPLIVRGDRDPTNLTYRFTSLSPGGQPLTRVLAPKGQLGSEVEIALGVDRTQMGGAAGGLFAGILRFTDSLGYTEIKAAVSARASASAGLWVGTAMVTNVNEQLTSYAKATNRTDFAAVLTRLGLGNGSNTTYHWESNSGRILVFTNMVTTNGTQLSGGRYLPESIQQGAGAVARAFPLRLIIHDTGSSAVLLPQVYYGMGHGSNAVLTTRQANLLTEALDSALRISAPHLPWSVNNGGFPFSGPLGPTANLTASVPLEFSDQASNPFIHSYHPDHDNLDPKYRAYLTVRGQESYTVRRTINLSMTVPADDFYSRTRGSLALSGRYSESVRFEAQGTDAKMYTVGGSFTLHRISSIPILLTSQ